MHQFQQRSSSVAELASANDHGAGSNAGEPGKTAGRTEVSLK